MAERVPERRVGSGGKSHRPIAVLPSVHEDCRYLAPRLRKADLREIRAVRDVDPLVALTEAMENSEACYTAYFGDAPMAIFGVVPIEIEPKIGLVWMMGTSDIERVKVSFLRKCRAWRDVLCQGYHMVGNFVDARNLVHIRWLKWLGFTFVGRHEEYGIEKLPFYEFVLVQAKE